MESSIKSLDKIENVLRTEVTNSNNRSEHEIENISKKSDIKKKMQKNQRELNKLWKKHWNKKYK